MPPQQQQGDDTPIYKKWWFWVATGVAAVIVIDIAVSASRSHAEQPIPQNGVNSGAVIFRF
jgi:hypothetical protein